MIEMLWFLCFGVILSSLIYLHERSAKKRVEREAQELFQVLDQLYGGNYIGGCNYRYDRGYPCGEEAGETKWCSPCRGRKLISELAHLSK